jgi:serine/threonine protein kinase
MFQVMLVSSQFADDSLYPISAREPEDVGQQEDVVLPQNTSHQGNAAMDGKQMEEPCEAMAAGLPLIPVSRWECYRPVEGEPILRGGSSIVVQACDITHRHREKLAIKIFIDTHEGAVWEEANILHAASVDLKASRYIVHLESVVSGELNEAWRHFFSSFSDQRICPGINDTWRQSLQLRGIGGPPVSFCALVTKFQPNGNLEMLMNSTHNPWNPTLKDKLEMAAKVAQGLWHLHNNSHGTIIHGDLKPQNILLTDANSPKLSDFGLAKRVIAEDEGISKTVRSREGELPGTWPYMAPEMFDIGDGKQPVTASRSTDIFALGMVFYYIFSQRCVLPWTNRNQRILSLKNPIGLDALALNTPGDMKTIIQECLAVDRINRPNVDKVLNEILKQLEAVSIKSWDIFLSYAWGSNKCHKPFANHVYLSLTNCGYRVWFDSNNIGTELERDMREGITNSRAVVILLSPDYAASRNCQMELSITSELKKPFVICMVEPGYWRTWKIGGLDTSNAIPDNSEIIQQARLLSKMYVDLSPASIFDWTTEHRTEEQLVAFAGNLEVFPKLKNQLAEIFRVGV